MNSLDIFLVYLKTDCEQSITGISQISQKSSSHCFRPEVACGAQNTHSKHSHIQILEHWKHLHAGYLHAAFSISFKWRRLYHFQNWILSITTFHLRLPYELHYLLLRLSIYDDTSSVLLTLEHYIILTSPYCNFEWTNPVSSGADILRWISWTLKLLDAKRVSSFTYLTIWMRLQLAFEDNVA